MRSARGDLTRPPRPEPPAGVLARQGPSPGFPRPQHPPGLAPGTRRWTCGLPRLSIRRASPTQASPSLIWALVPSSPCLVWAPGPTSPSIHTHTHPSAAPAPPLAPSTPGRSPKALRALLCSFRSPCSPKPRSSAGMEEPLCEASGPWRGLFCRHRVLLAVWNVPPHCSPFQTLFIISLPHLLRDPPHTHTRTSLAPAQAPSSPRPSPWPPVSPFNWGAPYDPRLEATLCRCSQPPGTPHPQAEPQPPRLMVRELTHLSFRTGSGQRSHTKAWPRPGLQWEPRPRGQGHTHRK